jgi:ABC-type oligopeptide transport system substrate-binding subunit
VSIAEPAALDPALVQEIEGAQVMRLLFRPLTTFDPDLELQPGAATEWSVAQDQVTWTFTLDEDAVFTDGSPVDASDFVFAMARAADPDLASPVAYQGYPIAGWGDVLDAEPSGEIGDVPVSGVTAIDDLTLQIVTTEPFALLPMLISFSIFSPVPSELADDTDGLEAFAEQPIGNGPYRMVEPWQHNESVTLERNPDFSGTPGRADTIEFRIYSDLLTAYRDFQSGALDIVRGIPSEEYRAASEEYGDRLQRIPTASLSYIGFPTQLAPFDNVDFRTALSMAIDREALADRVMQGANDQAGGVVPPQVPGALAGPCAGCVFDLDAAEEHFAASGVAPGTTIVLYDISDDGQAATEFIATAWSEAFGLDVEIRSFEFAQYLDELATSADVQGAFELGWAWDYPSGYSMLQPLFGSRSSANNLGWANDEFDALMEQVETSDDPEEVTALLREAQTIVEAELPVAPLVFASDISISADRVSGHVVDTAALHRLELVTVTD